MQHLQVFLKGRKKEIQKDRPCPPPLPLSISIKIENTLTGTEEREMLRSSQACRRERDRVSERENNIILKAITMNSPQFRHESAPLSLTGGRKKRERKEKGGREKKNSTLRRIPMSDRRLISAPGRILQTRL